MKTALLILQMAIASSLIVLILLQSKGAGLGSVFGGSGGVYRSRRGVEKLFVYITVILVFLFFLVSVLQILI